ncbi:Uma2 family endonuclease [Paludisphaera soli]|uniref:Uma2 family endonuclease n=1 Tax=Paludisphaera soli TaxID=2712865 RepID=UPI0013EA6686|nr:Uma2 family endonuclease [Paludisphaera soli]
MATVEQVPALMTAEEFARRPDSGAVEELVRGRIVMSPMPGARHGKVCNTFGRLLGNFVADQDVGHVLNNDSGVITRRGPDTVRGADVSYYSYSRMPQGEPPAGYCPSPPELTCEVLSPSDRWNDVLVKVGEYLAVGVVVVLILDPQARTATVFEDGKPPVTLRGDDVLRFDEILPEFEVAVGRLFA